MNNMHIMAASSLGDVVVLPPHNATRQVRPVGTTCVCVIVVHRTSTHSHNAIAMRHNHDWYMAMCTGIVCSPPDRCLVVFELVELDLVAPTNQFV